MSLEKKNPHGQIKVSSRLQTINILLSLTVLYCSERSLVLQALPPTSTYNTTMHSGKFSSYLSGELTTVSIVNQPDRELVKFTYNTTIAVVRQVRKVRRCGSGLNAASVYTLLLFQA